MAIAATLKQYLSDQGVDYDAVAHPHTGGSLETAEVAHVSGEDIAKAIVLKDEDGYLVAVLPATYRLQLGALREILGRRLEMADEKELAGLFTDCEPGAVPPVAGAYGLKAIWDENLARLKDVYFEGGDHSNLIRVSGEAFTKLMGDADRGIFSHHM